MCFGLIYRIGVLGGAVRCKDTYFFIILLKFLSPIKIEKLFHQEMFVLMSSK